MTQPRMGRSTASIRTADRKQAGSTTAPRSGDGDRPQGDPGGARREAPSNPSRGAIFTRSENHRPVTIVCRRPFEPPTENKPGSTTPRSGGDRPPGRPEGGGRRPNNPPRGPILNQKN